MNTMSTLTPRQKEVLLGDTLYAIPREGDTVLERMFDYLATYEHGRGFVMYSSEVFTPKEGQAVTGPESASLRENLKLIGDGALLINCDQISSIPSRLNIYKNKQYELLPLDEHGRLDFKKYPGYNDGLPALLLKRIAKVLGFTSQTFCGETENGWWATDVNSYLAYFFKERFADLQ